MFLPILFLVPTIKLHFLSLQIIDVFAKEADAEIGRRRGKKDLALFSKDLLYG